MIKLKENEYVTLETADEEISVDLLQVNDLIKIYPGGGVPIDGVVLFGKGIVDEAMLTGEARPITKDIGSKVFGGTTLL
jgi:Cu+-exporting ATPase